MALSLVYRATRPSLLATSTSVLSLSALSRRHASLSAIHKGLVRSEKARPQGARPDRVKDLAEGATRLTYAERRKAREELAKQRPTYKIRKGKKDITEYPDAAKAKSRQARFYDPDSSFGKKSLVYQLKTGKLRDELKSLQGRERDGSSGSAFQRTGPRPDLKTSMRQSRSSRVGDRASRSDKGNADAADVVAELSRPAGFTKRSSLSDRDARPQGRGPDRSDRGTFRRDRDIPRGRGFDRADRGAFSRDRDTPRRERDSDRGDRGGFRGDRDIPRRERHTDREDRRAFRGERDIQPRERDTGREDRGAFRRERDGQPRERDTYRDVRGKDRDSRPRDRDRESSNTKPEPPRRDSAPPTRPSKDSEPLSIPYTTAASQFLYGKAVVEAALRSSRRKLYKLYLHGGANRQNPADDALIQSLAHQKRVPTTLLHDSSGLRLMDKLSASRPHNGFVLEASPLPQPPLTALGALQEDYPTTRRIPLTLAHQSAEDAAINGTPSSLPLPYTYPTTTHKPLVVILDQVLDPGNLGAILRSLAFLGAAAVGITKRGSAGLTPVALKASAGAAEVMSLFSVGALPEFLNGSRENGWSVFAAVAGEGGGSSAGSSGAGGSGGDGVVKQRRHMSIRDVEEADPLRREPCVLLVGNEGEGLSRLTVKKADYEVNIPNLSGSTVVDSLNVSVAAGLLCSAFLRGAAREQETMGGKVGESLW